MKNTRILTVIASVLVAWMGLCYAMAEEAISAKDATIKWAFDKSGDNPSAADV